MKLSKKWIVIVIILTGVTITAAGITTYIFLNNGKDEKNLSFFPGANVSKNSDNNNVSGQINNARIELTYTIKREEFSDYIELIGSVYGEEYQVKTKVTGDVEKLYVDEGFSVDKGTVLAKIDDLEYRLDVLSKEIQLKNAYDEAPMAQKQYELEWEIAKKDLANTRITAPVAGIIQEVNVNEGEKVSQNTKIFTLLQDNALIVEAAIDEVDLKKIGTGKKAVIEFEQLGQKIDAKVSNISKIAENNNGLVTIPIELTFSQDPRSLGVISGLTCTIKISLSDNNQNIMIPLSTLFEEEGKTYIRKVEEGNRKGQIVYVETGVKTDDKVEILSGVEDGDVIMRKIDRSRLQEMMQQREGSQQKSPMGGKMGGMMRATGGGGQKKPRN